MTAPAPVRPHATAVLMVLASGGLSAYDGEGPAVRPPAGYVVLYFDAGTPDGTLGDRHKDLLVEFQVTAIGVTPEQCRWAADKARTVLLTSIPVVAGRLVHPLWQVGSPPPMRRDDDVQPPLHVLPVSYQLRSTIP